MHLLVNEILDNIESQYKTPKERIAVLKGLVGSNPEIKTLLAINFSFNGQGFNGLPEGIPKDYREDPNVPIGYSDMVLAGIWRKMYIFSDVNLNPKRKEVIFIQYLEGLHPLEAKLLILAKDGNLWQLYPWISDECAKEIFGIGKEEESKTEEVLAPLVVDTEVVDTTVTVKRGRGRPPKVK